MNIVILDEETLSLNNDIDFSVFDQYGSVKIYGSTGENKIVERISDADVVLCNKTPLFEKTLCKATKLKYIGLFATGYNNVDLEYTRKKGITVCNAGSYSTDRWHNMFLHSFFIFTTKFQDIMILYKRAVGSKPTDFPRLWK